VAKDSYEYLPKPQKAQFEHLLLSYHKCFVTWSASLLFTLNDGIVAKNVDLESGLIFDW
jgi:hypothetical protein